MKLTKDAEEHHTSILSGTLQQSPTVSIVYLITSHETEDSIGFGDNFKPEIFTNKEIADARFRHLLESRPPYNGIFFTLEPVEIDAHGDLTRE
jgi:hypothetical protein